MIAQQQNTAHVWTLHQIAIALLCHPRLVVEAYQKNALPLSVMYQYAAILAVLTGILFAGMTVWLQPQTLQWPTAQLVSRVGVWMLLMTLVIYPIKCIAWAVLQRLSAWFFDITLPIKLGIALTGLCGVYAVPILLASLPMAFLPRAVAQWGLFTMWLLLAFLSLRLFEQTYLVLGVSSPKKAWLMSVFPIILIAIVVCITQVLAWFASFHTHGM